MSYRIMLLGILWAATCIAAQADNAEGALIVKMSVLSKSPFYVKQAIIVHFDVLTSDAFSAEPELVLPNQDDFVIIDSPIAKGPISRSEKGQTLSGVYFEYTLFPTRSGALTLPAFQLKADILTSGQSHNEIWTSETQPLNIEQFTDKKNLDDTIVASQVKLEQSWSQNDTVAVGDALVRTITLKATGTHSMLLPQINLPIVAGASHYLDTPQLLDNSSRGEFYATQTNTITYVLEKSGDITIPEIRWYWLNTQTRTIENVVAESIRLKVNASSKFGDASHRLNNSVQSFNIWFIVLLIVVIASLVGLITLFKGTIEHHLRALKGRWQTSEPYHYQRLIQSIANDPPKGILSKLYAWRPFLAEDLSNELCHSEAWQQLQLACISGESADRKHLRECVFEARKKNKQKNRTAQVYLRPLYPKS